MNSHSRKKTGIFILPLLTLLFSFSSAVLASDGPWSLTLGAINVNPSSDASALKDTSGADIGSGLIAGSETQLGIFVDYRFSETLNLNVIAATPFTHGLTGSGALAGVDIGQTKHLPPTVVFQYHFPMHDQFKPFIGAGLNWTTFFEEAASQSLKNFFGTSNVQIEIDDSVGLALQAGFNVPINEQFDFYFMAALFDIDADADVIVDNVKTLSSKVEIDPLVTMAGVRFQF